MRGGIPEGAERMQGCNGFLAFFGCIDTLGFIDDDDGVCRLDEFDWAVSGHPVMGAVDNVGLVFLVRVGKALAKRIDVDDHNLDIITGGKIAHLAEFLRVVNEIVKRDVFIEPLEMGFRHLERFVDAFLDGHRGHHNDKLGKAV